MRGPKGWHYRFETDTQGGLRKTLAGIAPYVSVGALARPTGSRSGARRPWAISRKSYSNGHPNPLKCLTCRRKGYSMKDIASEGARPRILGPSGARQFGKGPGFARQGSSKAMSAGFCHDLCYAFGQIEPRYIASHGLRGHGLAARGRQNGIGRRF